MRRHASSCRIYCVQLASYKSHLMVWHKPISTLQGVTMVSQAEDITTVTGDVD